MASDMSAPGSVDYQLVIYDELPPEADRRRHRSILNEQLETIRGSEEAWGRPVRIALYSTGSTASSARATLERRFAEDPDWSFFVRPVPVSQVPDAPVHKGLFALYRRV